MGDLSSQLKTLSSDQLTTCRQNIAKSSLRFVTDQLHEGTYGSSPYVNRNDIRIPKDLAQDESIKITRPDKGKGIVIMDKAEYNQKLEQILSDRDKFKIISDDHYKTILSLEENLNRVLRPVPCSIGILSFSLYYVCLFVFRAPQTVSNAT